MEAVTKLLAEENRIMFANLIIIEPEKRAWFEKKRATICERDA
jgi:hypothetical protein